MSVQTGKSHRTAATSEELDVIRVTDKGCECKTDGR